MNQQGHSNCNNNQFRAIPDLGRSEPSLPINSNVSNFQQRNPPPLPPRTNRSVQSYQPMYGDHRSLPSPYYSGYGTGMNYRGYGGYGSYGGYGGMSGYNSYNQFGGPSGDVENRFVQLAEERTRPAFQSIETMVHTFSSITMMLESTFFAMTSSFRAILSVADNIGRLRSMFGHFLDTFALIRFMKWLYWKSMYTLGLRPDDPNSELLWRQTAIEVMNGGKTGSSSWPIFMFLSMLFAIPYLVHKLVHNAKELKINTDNPKEWFQQNEPMYTATATYDFNATCSEELSLRCGQKIWLAPKSLQPKDTPGWWKATDSVNVGLIPSSYVTVVGQIKKKSTVLEQGTAHDCSENIGTSMAQSSNQKDKCSFPDLEEAFGTKIPEEG
ncbi:peroxisomal membrane protein PEX13 isoform X1 [Neodiprion virginianus]|uniref:peroxisomal membrane protein PEX13 isoform X1 n=2 Tax=Neodiprion virginianus TaxID=2961670 RepID=UPI001EE6DDA0|nr:peroxisomal membrane protein PEX13 isoform X1 [Neodiprion virginianus]XP_046606491.1 peroxisomal membrane protein PEX13 isoform X1 [Neodiprion virginianus]